MKRRVATLAATAAMLITGVSWGGGVQPPDPGVDAGDAPDADSGDGTSDQPPVQPLYEHDPFTPWDLPGATPYDQLSVEDQEGVDDVMAWTLEAQSPEVHQAFSAACSQAIAQAQLQIAQRLTGLGDLGTLGVVP